MNYIGSKYKLSSFIVSTIKSVVGEDFSDKIFCDIFAGTGTVGRKLKKSCKQIIANDIEYYSFVLNKNYIENHKEIPRKFDYVETLNNLPLIDSGFIYQNYCVGGDGERQYFSDNNGKKIDAVRQKIEEWKTRSEISKNLYYFLLASLLESADKVANTASVYGSYLKKLKKSAQKEFILEPAIFELNDKDHQVYNIDSNELIQKISGDILYLDPPYNARQYGANYHLLNTIAEYKPFIPKGKTGLRDYQKSKYCSKVDVERTLDTLIQNAKFEYIFLSYNNEGLMKTDTIRKIMSHYGEYDCVTTNHRRFKADNNREYIADNTTEYLHILKKQG